LKEAKGEAPKKERSSQWAQEEAISLSQERETGVIRIAG